MGILRKLKRNKRFKEADLFYVLMSLLAIWRHLTKQVNGKYIALFNLRNVYLSPEGYVKMYPFPITLDYVSSPLRPKKSLSLARTNSIVESEEVEVVITPKKVGKVDSRLLFDTPSQVPRQLTENDSLRDIGVILLQLVLLNKESNEIEEFSTEKQAQLLLHLCSQGLLSLSLKDILMKLLLDYKNTSFNELNSMIEVYRSDQDRPVSTNIKLEDGPEFAEAKEGEDVERDKETGRDSSKTHSLKRLGEHGHLRAGSIGVLSKKSSRKS